MKRIISAVVVLIGLAAPASADTNACGDAYKRKDYAAALKECRPLAEAQPADRDGRGGFHMLSH